MSDKEKNHGFPIIGRKIDTLLREAQKNSLELDIKLINSSFRNLLKVINVPNIYFRNNDILFLKIFPEFQEITKKEYFRIKF
ncbi:MAG: hypothetical protein ACFFAN_04260 [Promethearchaeota archaeon]